MGFYLRVVTPNRLTTILVLSVELKISIKHGREEAKSTMFKCLSEAGSRGGSEIKNFRASMGYTYYVGKKTNFSLSPKKRLTTWGISALHESCPRKSWERFFERGRKAKRKNLGET